MDILSISYDLNKPGKDYESLYEVIKSAPAWAHPMDSLWFIKTSESVNAWSSKLKRVMDNDDYLFVVDITDQPRQGWMSEKMWDWLNSPN